MESKLETKGQTYLERLNLKTANKETNIYTYWNDRYKYQFKKIQENIDETKCSAALSDEKQVLQQQQSLKKTEPPDLWKYEIFAVVALGLLLTMLKFWREN